MLRDVAARRTQVEAQRSLLEKSPLLQQELRLLRFKLVPGRAFEERAECFRYLRMVPCQIRGQLCRPELFHDFVDPYLQRFEAPGSPMLRILITSFKGAAKIPSSKATKGLGRSEVLLHWESADNFCTPLLTLGAPADVDSVSEPSLRTLTSVPLALCSVHVKQ